MPTSEAGKQSAVYLNSQSTKNGNFTAMRGTDSPASLRAQVRQSRAGLQLPFVFLARSPGGIFIFVVGRVSAVAFGLSGERSKGKAAADRSEGQGSRFELNPSN